MTHKESLYIEHIGQPSDFLPLRLDIESAQGVFLYDTCGKRYLDLISGISVSNLGHGNSKIADAIKKQLDRYSFVMVYGEYMQSPQIELAKLLADNLPDPLSTTYFVNSGSEAIEGAIKLAKLHTKRTEIVAFKGAYHGSTHGTISIMGDETYKRPFRPLLPNINMLDFNSMESISQITELTACVVVEPVQAAPGIRVAELGFIRALADRCKAVGAILIFDEIQSGFGRTGTLFAFEQLGVVPDVLCMAKALGGGMPMGAFTASHALMDSLNNGHPLLGHATTFGGHPLCCVASKAALEILTTEDYISQVSGKHQLFKSLLVHPAIKDVRGMGFMIAIELEEKVSVPQVIEKAIKHGVIINGFLFNKSCLSISAPLIISGEQIHEACIAIKAAIDECVDS